MNKLKYKTHTCSPQIPNRYKWRLMHGGAPNTYYNKRNNQKRKNKHTHTYTKMRNCRSKTRKKCAGDWNSHTHNHFGFKWDRQSCWMDASLMSLFYPDAMYSAIHPFFQQNNNRNIHDVKQTLLRVISEMRDPLAQPALHGLRSILAQHIQTRDQEYAFQIENELGYVFYFLQELLKMFDANCMRAIEPGGVNYKKLFVMEMEFCNNNSVEQCLRNTYKKWSFHDKIADYMIIELTDDDGQYSVRPQEWISFLDERWELCSMIVFDCSHFISYVKENHKWFLYDDTRSLSHKEFDMYDFGTFYSNGSCRFQYGKNNTFFFYTRT